MKKKKLIALLLCVVLISSYLTYRVINKKQPFPDILVVAYGQETEKTRRLKDKIGDGTIHDIQTMVASSVAENLKTDGFICGTGIAHSVENEDITAAGLYYYEEGLDFFGSSDYQSVGFVQIVSDTVKYEDLSIDPSLIQVIPTDDLVSDKTLLCTYC